MPYEECPLLLLEQKPTKSLVFRSLSSANRHSPLSFRLPDAIILNNRNKINTIALSDKNYRQWKSKQNNRNRNSYTSSLCSSFAFFATTPSCVSISGRNFSLIQGDRYIVLTLQKRMNCFCVMSGGKGWRRALRVCRAQEHVGEMTSCQTDVLCHFISAEYWKRWIVF